MAGALNQADQTLVTVHAAVHEYKLGSPEHGRALFESLVARSPKRSDLWSTYLDQERGLLARNAPESSVTGVRHIFERAATVSLPPKVMQSMLTQWLSFETANGTPADVQKVKDKARSYVESRAAATATAVGAI
jgi:rRNA biogenesis protein RRP5